MAVCDSFHYSFSGLPMPNDVVIGALWTEPTALKQVAHCDQLESDTEASNKWQGLVTGNTGTDFLVCTRAVDGTLLEVCLQVPPHHLLAFGGRVRHARAANTGGMPHA